MYNISLIYFKTAKNIFTWELSSLQIKFEKYNSFGILHTYKRTNFKILNFTTTSHTILLQISLNMNFIFILLKLAYLNSPRVRKYRIKD